jgi:hypothetical protein
LPTLDATEPGELTLAYESMELTADPGLRLNAYSAEPGSPSRDALNLLASWAATPPRPGPPPGPRTESDRGPDPGSTRPPIQ